MKNDFVPDSWLIRYDYEHVAVMIVIAVNKNSDCYTITISRLCSIYFIFYFIQTLVQSKR